MHLFFTATYQLLRQVACVHRGRGLCWWRAVGRAAWDLPAQRSVVGGALPRIVAAIAPARARAWAAALARVRVVNAAVARAAAGVFVRPRVVARAYCVKEHGGDMSAPPIAPVPVPAYPALGPSDGACRGDKEPTQC